jgi:hypothetical protein
MSRYVLSNTRSTMLPEFATNPHGRSRGDCPRPSPGDCALNLEPRARASVCSATRFRTPACTRHFDADQSANRRVAYGQLSRRPGATTLARY